MESLTRERKTPDHRDLVLEDLAASEAALVARVADLESDLAVQVELTREAIHALAAATAQREQLATRVHRLLDELREARRYHPPSQVAA